MNTEGILAQASLKRMRQQKEYEREIELWEAVVKSGLVEKGRMKNADAD